MNKTIGFAITGSFCCIEQIKEEIIKLLELGYDVIPIITPIVNNTDTRFGTSEELKQFLFEATNKKPITTIPQAEPLGPKNLIDAIVIAPCTGNTLAKLANGISDNAVTMATKSLMRNGKPVIIAISTNDALGLNLNNIAKLINAKNIYFVPFGQDNFESKPKSMVANFKKIIPTLQHALNNSQIQPILE